MGQNGNGATKHLFWRKRNGLEEFGKQFGDLNMGENELLYGGKCTKRKFILRVGEMDVILSKI